MPPFFSERKAICFAAVVALLWTASPAQRRTLLNVPQDYKSIQAAVNAARVGDTVLVDHGIYYESLRINKNIVLASRFMLDGDTAHISRTIIDGSRYKDWTHASTVIVEGSTDTNAVICGLTIRGGHGTLVYYETVYHNVVGGWRLAGGGIFIRSLGARVCNNILTENIVSSDTMFAFGGGIGAIPSQRGSGEYVLIEKNLIVNNKTSGLSSDGGGVCLRGSGSIVANTIQLNTALASVHWSVGGGICVGTYYEATVRIEKNRVLENEARRGGGIGCYGKAVAYPIVHVTLTNNIVFRNRGVERGGGIGVWEMAEAYLINNTIVENTSATRGSGLDIGNGNGYLLNNVLYNNAPSPQLFTTFMVQAHHNVVQDVLFGDHNVTDNPRFRSSDLSSVEPNSPVLGRGKTAQLIHGVLISCPTDDIDGRKRPSQPSENPDIGALEYATPAGLQSSEDHAAKLSVWFSADTNYVRSQTPFSVENRATKVVMALNDTMFLDSLRIAEGIYLPSYDAILMLEFTNTTKRDLPPIWASYILEGRDHEDKSANVSTFTGYSGLTPGVYTLKIRSEHSQFINLGWVDDAVTIHVPPPWWETWWFRTSVVVFSLALFSLIYRREVSRLRREKLAQQMFSRLQIESQEAERKRLAAELHDGLGQNLLLASNELQQYLQQQDGTREEVQQAAHLLQESIHSVREMASNLHPHQLERLGFTAALTAMVDAISHATGLTVRLKCENVDRLLPRDSEVHLYRIVQEALSNVVRHSSTRIVSIEIRREAEKIKFEVKDDGKGFDRESVMHAVAANRGDGIRGFGLSSMAERARIIGAELNIETDAGKGTAVIVSVPYV